MHKRFHAPLQRNTPQCISDSKTSSHGTSCSGIHTKMESRFWFV